MDGSTSVQRLIDQFELMAQTNSKSAAPCTWSTTRNTKAPLPKPDGSHHDSPVEEIMNCFYKQHTQTTDEPDEKAIQDAVDVIPATPAKPTIYRGLTINILQPTDDVTAYEDGSTPIKSTYYLAMPRSPSTYSTASTCSLDSSLSSLDMFFPELLQASGRTASETTNLHSTKASKLAPPPLYRCATLTEKPMKKPSNLASAAPMSARPRRSSLSSSMVPSTANSTHCFSEGACNTLCARSYSSSSPVARYMDYDRSPRFAATKAMNVERRRRLQERNRNIAFNKVMRSEIKPRTPEWQGRLDHVRSRLFDLKENNQSLTSKAKKTASRRHSTSNCPLA